MIHSLRFNMSKQAEDIPDQKDSKRVPKPLMEKRRRDRINQSLETLRLLLLENTHNEKLKNPKVEKAEILESVVNFLRAEQRSGTNYPIKRGLVEEEYDEDLGSPCKRQRYSDGMRTCLLRVSHFIASKSQELQQGAEKAHKHLQHSPLEHSKPAQLLSAAPAHRDTQVHLYDNSLILAQQRQVRLNTPEYCSKLTKRTVSTTTRSKQPTMFCDSVWRPWPQ